MAIISPLQGTGGISDRTINAMLQSGDPNLISQANEYISSKEQQAEELGTNQGILGTLSDLFGFSTLAAAEPNQPIGQRNSLQFSVTQPSQFTFKPTPIVPGNIDMAGSVFKNYPYNQEATTGGINQILSPEEQLKLYLQEEGGEIDREYGDKFRQQNFFSKAKNFAGRPDFRTGLGYLLGGIPGAALSFFAPRISGGISDLVNRFRRAPTVTPMNLNDYTDAGSTTAFGQDVSSGDLTSITDDRGQDTGFSEYSSPEVASAYEGSF